MAGSISEKLHLSINGARRGMFIQSKDERLPVLLFLHGGPGMPEYFLTQSYPTVSKRISPSFGGNSAARTLYNAGIPPETMTAEQLVADTLAVTTTSRRFNQDKIYLMGHSGEFIGILAAARAPRSYHAYIGRAR